MGRRKLTLNPGKQQLLIIVFAVIALYVIVPQLSNFHRSLSLISTAHGQTVLWAVALTAASYAAGAGTYMFLALHPIRYGRTALIQVAATFINRLLPAGIGGIGINYAYLRRARHTGTESASVVAANNALGIIGHLLLLTGFLLTARRGLPPLHVHHLHNQEVIVALVAILLAAWLVFYSFYKEQLRRAIYRFIGQFLQYRKQPRKVLLALLCSMTLTLSNVLSLWCCTRAVNIHLSLVTILLVFSFGVALGTATPTPGGLGGVEAGMVAGLVVYHITGAAALAAVLLYRLISYWLPLIVGAVSFIYIQRRNYLKL